MKESRFRGNGNSASATRRKAAPWRRSARLRPPAVEVLKEMAGPAGHFAARMLLLEVPDLLIPGLVLRSGYFRGQRSVGVDRSGGERLSVSDRRLDEFRPRGLDAGNERLRRGAESALPAQLRRADRVRHLIVFILYFGRRALVLP